MKKLRVERTQWAVGNGFFHTGTIGADGQRITYAYDCGALNRRANQHALDREIKECTYRLRRIDVFFVSHFDYDHVCGINKLSKLIPVERFVIPLIPAAERLLRLVWQLQSQQPPPDPAQNDFYLDLVADPIGTLESRSRSEPIVVEPTTWEEPPQLVDSAFVPPPEAPLSVGPIEWEPIELEVTPHPSLSTVTASSETVWVFRQIVAREASGVTTDFVDELVRRKLIGHKRDLDDPKVVKQLVLTHLQVLKEAYLAAVTPVGASFTLNLTSLMLYSGPPVTSRIRTYRTRSWPVERRECGAWGCRPGFLGLGDADMRAKGRIDHVNHCFRKEKSYTGTFAPSHHGSKRDWNAGLLKGFTPDDVAPNCVFSASGAYGHPSSEAILDVNNLGGISIVVSTDIRSRWTEEFTVYVTEH